jgi:hypothetical protein
VGERVCGPSRRPGLAADVAGEVVLATLEDREAKKNPSVRYGVDVDRSLRIATRDVAVGGKIAVRGRGGPTEALAVWTLNSDLGIHLELGGQAASATLLSLGGLG